MTVPPLVRRAHALAAEAGFDPAALRDDHGKLLHVLAAARGIRRVAEVGTGCGVGTAWIVSALAPDAVFVGAERDPVSAAVAERLLADDGAARVEVGDWRDALPPEAPFDLVHLAARAAWSDPDAIAGLLTPGGCAVAVGLDESATVASWLDHSAFAAVVLGVGGASPVRALVAARTR